ncbi:MAG: lytic transglycosylase domain-containing protein [Sulfurovaceae bacterium]|nr:lytic transglycosylase domain-containing protein [Sulfurovaceae bacterium]
MGIGATYYKLTIKLFLALIVFNTTTIQAKIYSLKEIELMPKSISKDYYIWRFLEEGNATKEEALKAYSLTKRKSYKLKKAIRKKVGFLPNKKKVTPKDPNNYVISPEVAVKKSKKSLKQLYKKIKDKGQYSNVLKVMANDNPFETLKTVKSKTICYIFNHCQTKYRKKYFNYPFSKEQLEKLAKEKQFNKSIFKIVTTHDLDKLKKSLVNTPVTSNLTFKTTFLLAINAVEFNQIKTAIDYIKKARKKTKRQSQYDQCDFWLYLLSSDKKYLQNLLESPQINIYTLKARDIANRPYPKTITPNLGFHLVRYIDPYNPIDWENIKIDMKNHPETIEVQADNYRSYSTEGIYSYLKEKASHYIDQYFDMPYRDAMFGKSKERIALIYAIGRQESRFVPASVSTSYALGMMQIMPFLIKHLSKKRGKSIDLDDIFNPYVAIDYANQHLDYLNKFLYHPLFVAYAYNGGIGFTKRTIKSNHLFKIGKYEPYLSMELIDYEQSREYGKKVLANYVIYLNKLGVETKISSLLNKLDKPLETDKFR